MSYLEESLSDNEQIQKIFALHWTSKIPLAILIIAIIPTLGITLIFAIMEWLRLRTLEQAVTNKRVIKKTGIISRKTEEMKIHSIETVEILQSVLGRLLGYGTVKVTGRGISDLVFKNIDDPMFVKKAIESIN